MDEARAEVSRTVNGVILINCWLKCPICRELAPVQLRVMGDGVVRNQPRCGKCRHSKKEKKT